MLKSDLSKVTVYSISSIAGTLAFKYCLENTTVIGDIVGLNGALLGSVALYKLFDTTIKMTIRRIKESKATQKDVKVLNNISNNKGCVINWNDEWDKQIKLIDAIIKNGSKTK